MLDDVKIELLRSLATEKNPNPLKEFIHIFLSEAPRYISQIRSAESYDKASKPAHTLKSSAENMGAKKLSDVCKKIEFLSGPDGSQKFTELVEMLEAEFKTVKAELEMLLTSS